MKAGRKPGLYLPNVNAILNALQNSNMLPVETLGRKANLNPNAIKPYVNVLEEMGIITTTRWQTKKKTLLRIASLNLEYQKMKTSEIIKIIVEKASKMPKTPTTKK